MPVLRPWDSNHRESLPLPSREEFLAGKRRRFGQTNPELMEVPFWDYMVRTENDPDVFRGIYPFEDESVYREQWAIWSYRRSGISQTLYRGRYQISIGGGYWDTTEPDYLIYNDVIVRDPSGKVWIYGYPRESFPPTDFHSATLLPRADWNLRMFSEVKGVPENLKDGIVIIGGLGYPEEWEFWRTPVYYLDLDSLTILPLSCGGDEPGWIYEHQAKLLPGGTIDVWGGKRISETLGRVPNDGKFSLDLCTLRWTNTG